MKLTERIRNVFANYMVEPMTIQKGRTVIKKQADEFVTASVTRYKQAVNSAKSQVWQDRSLLYQIYQNILDFDTHATSLIELRLINTVGKKLEYVINDQPVDITALVESPRFEMFLRDLLMVRFWGFGVFEFVPMQWRNRMLFDYQKIPLLNVDPYASIIFTGEYQSGTKIPIKDNIITVGDKNDMGLFLQLALLSIYRRANRSSWANYNELAGDNFMLIKYKEPEDPKERQRLRSELANRDRNAIVDMVGDADISNNTTGNGGLFQTFLELDEDLRDEIARLILGQTMTTSDGSSYSQAEVHERQQGSIFDGDAKYLLQFLNFEFYDQLYLFGIPEGGTFRFMQRSAIVDVEQIDADLKLKELGVVFTQYEIREKYNLKTTNP